MQSCDLTATLGSQPRTAAAIVVASLVDAPAAEPTGNHAEEVSMGQEDIDSLVERARRGDMDALGSLYDEFAPRVYRFLRFRVDSSSTTEDLVSKVFLKMVEQLPAYRPTGVPFGAWVFRIARNTWIDHGRTSHPTVPLEDLTGETSGSGDPEALAEASIDAGSVRRAIEALPANQRDVIACRFFAGLSPQETALAMNRTEGSVRVLQHRALAGLRRGLSRGGSLAWTTEGSGER